MNFSSEKKYNESLLYLKETIKILNENNFSFINTFCGKFLYIQKIFHVEELYIKTFIYKKKHESSISKLNKNI